MESINDIKQRIIDSDLVSSRLSLLDDIDEKFSKIESCGYDTPAKLRDSLKTKKRLESLQQETGLSIEYLKLLKREIESYFPKKIKLTEFIYTDKTVVDRCIQEGIKDSLMFYDKYSGVQIEEKAMRTLFNQVRLTRIQWVSPMAAEMFISAGYKTPEIIKKANAEKFCSDVMEVNKSKEFFKGNIGLRDIKRVIKSAGYID